MSVNGYRNGYDRDRLLLHISAGDNANTNIDYIAPHLGWTQYDLINELRDMQAAGLVTYDGNKHVYPNTESSAYQAWMAAAQKKIEGGDPVLSQFKDSPILSMIKRRG